jgi:hypothetical protein
VGAAVTAAVSLHPKSCLARDRLGARTAHPASKGKWEHGSAYTAAILVINSSPRAEIPIEILREAAEYAVTRGSLRGVARRVGMSPTGLGNFIRGTGDLYSATRRKLERWYIMDHLPTRDDEPSPQVAAAALEVILGGLPLRARRSVEEGLLQQIRLSYEERNLRVPAWLAGTPTGSDE